MSGPEQEPVGSVADEAAKLFGALSDWAGDRLGDRVGDRVGDRGGGVGEHLANGSAECLYCPVCRTVHAVRQASPEVRAQLATAASSFLEAAAGLLAAAGEASAGGPRDARTPRDPASRVQRIDLDADPGPETGPDAGPGTRRGGDGP